MNEERFEMVEELDTIICQLQTVRHRLTMFESIYGDSELTDKAWYNISDAIELLVSESQSR